ncbi:MAG: CtpF protein [Devosiaceae bacterium]|nr:CtpF protein [Devosiaceae bacterium MH13]
MPPPLPQGTVEPVGSVADIAPVPRISMQAFCETPALLDAVQEAARDRRMAKAHVRAHPGGISAALEFYAASPTPNLLIIENRAAPAQLLGQLEQLAEVCDPGTEVVIVGHANDVLLYRELMRQGVRDYVVAPLAPMDIVRLVSDLYASKRDTRLGKTFAFIGARGGVGSSTIAHNVAWSFANTLETSTVLADFDLPFGTANLDFNQDPPTGVGDIVSAPDRLDETFLDRLLAKCSDRLSLLASPSTLEKVTDFPEQQFEQVIDLFRASVPVTVIDLPHHWSGWVRKTLVDADELIIVAAPDLASLRNAKNLIDAVRTARPNDGPPRLILNMSGMPKRPEIEAKDFADALSIEPMSVIAFDAETFGNAANSGHMIAESAARHDAVQAFDDIAHALSGRAAGRSQKKGSLPPFVQKLLQRKKAS